MGFGSPTRRSTERRRSGGGVARRPLSFTGGTRFRRPGHIAGRGGRDVHGDGHVRAGAVRQRDRHVPDRVGPGSGHGGGQRHIQHAGRVGVRRPGRQEGHRAGQVAAAPGQRRIHRGHRHAGRNRRRRRGHVVRGDVHVGHVLRLLPVDVHTGQAPDGRQKVEEQKFVPLL